MHCTVALFTRAWIEIGVLVFVSCGILSPSLRGRGLKYDQLAEYYDFLNVALFTRAWIEIPDSYFLYTPREIVALFTRAWIEIKFSKGRNTYTARRPLYEGVD